MRTRALKTRPQHRESAAFSLVELLVVVGILAILIAILLPLLGKAQRHAKDVTCKSNMRQLCLLVLNYAAENKGKFPPSINRTSGELSMGLKPQWWCDGERIGKYLKGGKLTSQGTYLDLKDSLTHPSLVCPEDEQASRSYAMNYWASSAVSINNGALGPPDFPKAGKPWSANVKGADKLFLVAEVLSFHRDGMNGWMSWPTVPRIDYVNSVQTERFWPGFYFIGDIRHIGSSSMRYVPAETDFDWSRHRRRGDGGTRISEARGRANFGFADGHVADFTPDELAHRTSRRSKFVVLWSALDYYADRFPLPY